MIGAGIAGLVCAEALTRAEHDVLLVEARDRVGGRALSRTTEGCVIELGPTWFWPDEPLIDELVRRLDVPTFAQHIDGDALFEDADGSSHRLAGNPIDAPARRFVDGSQSLAQRLATGLAPGTLHLDAPVSEITVDGDGVRVQAAGEDLLAGQAVVAMPPALAVEQIAFTPPLPAAVADTARATPVWMGAVVKAGAVYEQPFWRRHGLAGAAISHCGSFKEFHDHTGPDDRPAALFGFGQPSRLAAADPHDVTAAFRKDLTRLFGPEAAHPRAIHALDWSRERWTSPIRPASHASTRTYGSPAFRTPTYGRVHWASTETAAAHAGHLEGAVRAGRDAARRVIAGS
ncbi:MAG: FAD-dependent oxidoreductase [Actinomycetota bacterium]|nr:FAD-dependent oxidoreductase [Actinomycetota bacterium]